MATNVGTMEKIIVFIDGTIHLEINGAPAEYSIPEMKATGAKVSSVTKRRVQGIMMNTTLEQAEELIRNGWGWV